MNRKHAHKILLNATAVTAAAKADLFEFILDTALHVRQCLHVESLSRGIITPVFNFVESLEGQLFELNHVRVNPQENNTLILHRLRHALHHIGLKIHHAPEAKPMALSFKPLGEIAGVVRFYLQADGTPVFLSPKPQLYVIRKT